MELIFVLKHNLNAFMHMILRVLYSSQLLTYAGCSWRKYRLSTTCILYKFIVNCRCTRALVLVFRFSSSITDVLLSAECRAHKGANQKSWFLVSDLDLEKEVAWQSLDPLRSIV